MILRLKFKKSVLSQIKSDGVLLLRMHNIIGGTMAGLLSMIERNSQTLMHIGVVMAVSDRLNIPIEKLYEKI